MKSYNDIGIDNKLDKDRIAHLFKLGIVASILALSADMILGWGVADDSLTGLDQYFSRYLTVSDVRIIRLDQHRQPDNFYWSSYNHEESQGVIFRPVGL
ncbi:MAG: hypothetical protein K6E12_06705 [Saccharofermentans sp.]|nr:hypothetical protein [Saccharofermentans sp.]